MRLKFDLKSERKKRGWLASYVAKEVGVSQGAISFWENGHKTPKPAHLARLLQLFGKSDLLATFNTIYGEDAASE